jgi:hypothetical protein
MKVKILSPASITSSWTQAFKHWKRSVGISNCNFRSGIHREDYIYLTLSSLGVGDTKLLARYALAHVRSRDCKTFSIRKEAIQPCHVTYLKLFWHFLIGILEEGGGVESNWVHSALRSPIILLCQPRVIRMMEKFVERWWQGKPKY